MSRDGSDRAADPVGDHSEGSAGESAEEAVDDPPADRLPEPLLAALRPRLDRSRRLHVCLDFDGTLAPITDAPGDARMLASARRPLERLCRAPAVEVSVVSGRALSDVADRVDLPGACYAGNHGFEIRVDGETERHPEAKARRPALEAAVAELRTRLATVPGARVEDKGATATVHYRETPDDDVGTVRAAVESAAESAAPDGLRVTEGKQVLELRPAVDCDKGVAVDRLAADDPGTLLMYVGDDRTDEAAFERVAPDGVGVLIGDREDTAATRAVPDPESVAALLEWLAEAGVDRLADR
jgi:trehalose 6-phosphate phosphatase